MSIICAIIDWETLGLNNNCKVLAVGMTAFDIQTESTIDELRKTTWSTNITLEDQINRMADQSTVDWWAQQSEEAQTAIQADPKLLLSETLVKINEFCLQHGVKYLIGNGENFDNAILKDACEQYGVEYPVAFYEDADLRTMKLMAGLPSTKSNFPPQLTAHVAADDAIFEAMVAQTCYRKCRNGWG